MTMPSKITDHAAQAVGNLLSEFRNSDRLKELITIFAAEIQSLENLFHELYDECTLDTAVGVQLDMEGKIVGWPRMGLSDDDYRAMIKVAIVINQTDGDAITATYIISQIVGVAVHYRWCGMAHCSFEWEKTSNSSTEIQALIQSILDKILVAGVSAHCVEGITDCLRYDAGPGYDQGKLGWLIAQIGD